MYILIYILAFEHRILTILCPLSSFYPKSPWNRLGNLCMLLLDRIKKLSWLNPWKKHTWYFSLFKDVMENVGIWIESMDYAGSTLKITSYRISSYSFRPWIVSCLEKFPHLYVLWPLDLQAQKRIVSAETIWGNTVYYL